MNFSNSEKKTLKLNVDVPDSIFGSNHITIPQVVPGLIQGMPLVKQRSLPEYCTAQADGLLGATKWS